MTLLELLVQELPKLGGWPEGAYGAAQDGDGLVHFHTQGRILLIGMTWRFATANGVWLYQHKTLLASDFDSSTITREQYEAALAASQKVEWDGAGLPPVGTECEYCDKNTSEWMVVNVTYLSSDVIVIRRNYPECSVEMAIDLITDSKKARFRPLRTEADKKRDEAVEELINLTGISPESAAICYDVCIRMASK